MPTLEKCWHAPHSAMASRALRPRRRCPAGSWAPAPVQEPPPSPRLSLVQIPKGAHCVGEVSISKASRSSPACRLREHRQGCTLPFDGAYTWHTPSRAQAGLIVVLTLRIAGALHATAPFRFTVATTGVRSSARPARKMGDLCRQVSWLAARAPPDRPSRRRLGRRQWHKMVEGSPLTVAGAAAALGGWIM